MPLFLQAQRVEIELADLAKRVPLTTLNAPRSPGLHQSDILRVIAEETGKLDKQTELEELGHLPLIMASGFMWEEFVMTFYPWIEHQPGERNVIEGIPGSIDGINGILSPWTTDAGIEECKWTLKKVYESAEEMLAENWMWEHAMRGYLGAWNLEWCRWHVFHVRGDYKAFGPVWMQYVVQFSATEIRQTQKMLEKWRGKAEREKEERELLSGSR
jgi:hypothetical protein